ncbi:SGNH/GDSL hydrolase family protein [Rhizobiaceae sp. 2RAB30]
MLSGVVGCAFVLCLHAGFHSSTADAGAAMHLVTFGTSLTARGGWQEPLRAKLEKCLSEPVEISVIARSGSTTDWALAEVANVVAARPDIVLIEFYANDAALNRFMTVGRSRANIEMILDKLREGLPNSRIIMMIMSPISGVRGLIRPFLSSYIEAHRAAAEERGIEVVDHTSGWSKLSPSELDAAIPDGSHPLPEVATRIIVPTLTREICGRAE